MEEKPEVSQLIREKAELEEKVRGIISAQKLLTEASVKSKKERLAALKAERRRFSLLNKTDREPLTQKISAAREELYDAQSALSALNSGNCPQCDPYRIRIGEIIHQLKNQE